MIALIYAVSTNGVIGNDGKLPWNLPVDLKYFKKITDNNVVVMGRKTYESIGKPLPNRINVVLTRDNTFNPNDKVIVAHSLEDVLFMFKDVDVFVIGGAEIYSLFAPIADKIYETRVNCVIYGDTRFPFHELRDTKWNIVSLSSVKADKNNEYDCLFSIYERNGVFK